MVFRNKKSTSSALIDLLKEMSSGIDNKKVSIGIFIDLKKDFDTTEHSILFKKLQFYGITGIAYKWLESYLENRK